MNPAWGREYENTRKEEKPDRVKKVLVAGGGPGGMEAAITAARRGHNVILCEKSDHLAANLDYSKQLSFKKDIVEFLKSMMLGTAYPKSGTSSEYGSYRGADSGREAGCTDCRLRS